MSSRTVQVVGGPGRQHAYVDDATNALLVKVVNPGSGGGPTADVNLADYGGSAVGAGNAIHVQPGTGAVFDVSGSSVTVGNFPTVYPVNDNGGSLTVDGTVAISGPVAVTQSTSPWVIGDGGGTISIDDGGGSLTVDGTVAISGSVSVTQGTSPWVIGDGGGSITVDGSVTATQGTSPWVVGQSTHASLNAQVRLQDRDGSDLLSVLVIDSNAVFPMADTGTVPLALVTDDPTAPAGVWAALRLNEAGALYVAVNSGTIVVSNLPTVYPVNDNGGSLTVDGTVAATQSGTWNIATVTAVSSVNALIPGTGATNLGKAEDAAHASGDTGVMALAVRNDTPSALAGTDGDYIPLTTDNTGRLYVNVGAGTVAVTQSTSPWVVSGTVAATQSGTWNIGTVTTVTTVSAVTTVNAVIPGTGATNLGKAEDAAHASGDIGVMALAVRNDTASALAGTNGDYIPLTTDSSGRLHVNVGNSTLAVTQSGSWLVALVDGTVVDVQGSTSLSLGKAEDAVHTSGDTGVMALAVRNDTPSSLASANGDYIPLTVDSTGKLHVNVGNSTLAVTQSGTWNIGTVTTVTGVTTVSTVTTVSAVTTVNAVIPGTGATNLGKAEDAAHASGDTGVFVLAVRNDTPSSLANANGDYIPLTTDSSGRLHVSVFGNTAKTDICKAEDAASADGDVGIAALVVRSDTLASTTSANGDYTNLKSNSVGALWTKEYGVTTIALSGSTRGRPIQITGTGTGSTVTVHTATTTSGEVDKMYIYLTNTSASSVTVTLEFGTTGTANELYIVVPAKETVVAVDGAVIGGAATDTVKAYASTANVVNVFGRVERLAA